MKTGDTNRPWVLQWPTLLVCLLCYGGFAFATLYADGLGLFLSGVLLTLSLTLYSSFNHEVLHGHPFRNPILNTLLVFPALGLLIPYPRFRDTHLAHHHDPSLTDPYDDPETNFVDPSVWARWSGFRQTLYRVNNTLLGRMTFGPAIGLATFYKQDIVQMWQGNRRVVDAYLFHAAGLVPVLWWLSQVASIPFWHYAVAVYLSHSILKIRTFLEHRAHEKARCRSVIIEDRGPLSFLFLNNNLHAVHHACPNVPWYRLPAVYAARRDGFRARNGHYSYASYARVAGLYLVKAKDPVPHTLWSVPQEQTEEQVAAE